MTPMTASSLAGQAFVKGHGTGNDFLLLPDPDGALELTEDDVRSLCDRRTGIGADGVLRVVRTLASAEGRGLAAGGPAPEWFMDHRNADGSRPEMCGNGSRVFAWYLVQAGLVDDPSFEVLTRGGVRAVEVTAGRGDVALVSVVMGRATTPRARIVPQVSAGGGTWPAVGVLVPNPHAVVFVESLADAGDLHAAPSVEPPEVFPDGVNVEFVVPAGEDRVAVRVHERGVGETQACGTGACAVAWAVRRREGEPVGAGTVTVEMPGGAVQVTEHDDGTLVLTGPAELVAAGIWRAGRPTG